jgi:hypothetical protein
MLGNRQVTDHIVHEFVNYTARSHGHRAVTPAHAGLERRRPGHPEGSRADVTSDLISCCAARLR